MHEIRLGFTHALKGCRVAGLHFDAHNLLRVVVHRVTEAAVAMLLASLLDVQEEAAWGWVQAIFFLGHDAYGLVLPESLLDADFLESSVSPFCPVGAAVL